MNNADYLILAVLALSAFLGLWRGFVTEVFSLTCWVAAFWVAWMFGNAVAEWYGQWLHQPPAQAIAGYLTCFLSVLIIGALIGWALRKLIRASPLSGTDRMLGTAFGLARGVLLVSLTVLILAFTPARGEPWWHRSTLLPSFSRTADWLSGRLPEQAIDYMRSGEQALRADRQALSKLPSAPISVPHPDLPVSGASTHYDAPNAKPAAHRAAGDVGQ
ncbi:MAG TPA: CvpA family protein [Rhodanobacteraceae bacterium]|nr:CvpA family protein [Rhodanobacteraceae bacterium]